MEQYHAWLDDLVRHDPLNGIRFRAGRPTPGSWVEEEVTDPYTEDWFDTYFTPRRFRKSDGIRSNDTALHTRWLYADLDEAAPMDLPHVPTWWWETSPGSFQGMWLLTSPLSEPRASEVNKALTYNSGADLGGWHGSKLLRVPLTYNGKRDCYVGAPNGTGAVYDPNSLPTLEVRRNRLVTNLTEIDKTFDISQPLPYNLWRELVEMHRPQIGSRLVRDLHLPVHKVYDRSKLIWRVAAELAHAQVPPTVAFALIEGAAWNKWRASRGKLERDIVRAYQKGWPEIFDATEEA